MPLSAEFNGMLAWPLIALRSQRQHMVARHMHVRHHGAVFPLPAYGHLRPGCRQQLLAHHASTLGDLQMQSATL